MSKRRSSSVANRETDGDDSDHCAELLNPRLPPERRKKKMYPNGKPQFTDFINTTIGSQDVDMILETSLNDSSLASPAAPLSIGGNSDPYNPSMTATPSQERLTSQLSATPTSTKKKEQKLKIVTAYILYSSEVRKTIIANYPGCTFGTISRMVGKEWRSLPASTKQSWEERAAKHNEETSAKLAEERKTPTEVTYECAWDTCDFQFEDLIDCMEHCIGVGGNSVSAAGHVQHHYRGSWSEYPCLWRNCACLRKGKAPFPNLPRLLRHVRNLHVNKGNGRIMAMHEMSRNFTPATRRRRSQIRIESFPKIYLAPVRTGISPGGGTYNFINNENSNNNIEVEERDKEYSSYLNKTFTLPVTFFNIHKNIVLLKECRPLSVKIVDCEKYPCYFNKFTSRRSTTETIDSVVNVCVDHADATSPVIITENGDVDLDIDCKDNICVVDENSERGLPYYCNKFTSRSSTTETIDSVVKVCADHADAASPVIKTENDDNDLDIDCKDNICVIDENSERALPCCYNKFISKSNTTETIDSVVQVCADHADQMSPVIKTEKDKDDSDIDCKDNICVVDENSEKALPCCCNKFTSKSSTTEIIDSVVQVCADHADATSSIIKTEKDKDDSDINCKDNICVIDKNSRRGLEIMQNFTDIKQKQTGNVFYKTDHIVSQDIPQSKVDQLDVEKAAVCFVYTHKTRSK